MKKLLIMFMIMFFVNCGETGSGGNGNNNDNLTYGITEEFGGEAVYNSFIFKNELYFTVGTDELQKVDTSGKAILVKKFDFEVTNPLFYIKMMANDNYIYFIAEETDKLYKSDGTESGTVEITGEYDKANDFVVTKSGVYFTSDNYIEGKKILYYSASNSTTSEKIEEYENYEGFYLFSIDDNLYIVTNSNTSESKALYLKEGINNIVKLYDFPETFISEYGYELFNVNKKIIMITIGNPMQIWYLTATEPKLLKEFDEVSSVAGNLVISHKVINDILYFLKENQTGNNINVYKTDTTELNTIELHKFTGEAFSNNSKITELNGKIYVNITKYGTNSQYGLYSSDGNSAFTKVNSINLNDVANIISTDDKLYIYESGLTKKIYEFNGTEIKANAELTNDMLSFDWINFNNKIYFYNQFGTVNGMYYLK